MKKGSVEINSLELISKVGNKKIQIKKKNAKTKEVILSWKNNRH